MNNNNQLNPTTPASTSPAPTLPTIIVNDRQLRDIRADALDALVAANEPPYMFSRANNLTRLRESGMVEVLTADALTGELTKSADFVRAGEKTVTEVPPPQWVARDILELPGWPDIPELRGIVNLPQIRPDGTIADNPGFDPQTGIYYRPDPSIMSMPPIPDHPGPEDIHKAGALLSELIRDFPFTEPAGKANTIATIISSVLRRLIEGPYPLVLFDKPTQGTGATLLTKLIGYIMLGHEPAFTPFPAREEEVEKRILGFLLEARPVIIFDNVARELKSSALELTLTANTYMGRTLGKSEIQTPANNTLWMATGNNLRVTGNLPRRCVWIRLNAEVVHPHLRNPSSFQHPGEAKLLNWVLKNRPAIIHAILTLTRSWIVAGEPEAPGQILLGSYDSYCRTLGGILWHAQITGFLTNTIDFYDEMDTDMLEWDTFLSEWLAQLGEGEYTASELVDEFKQRPELRKYLPETVSGIEADTYTHSLGKYLSHQRDKVFPSGVKLYKPRTKRKAAHWAVLSARSGSEGEFGEFVAGFNAKKKYNDSEEVITEDWTRNASKHSGTSTEHSPNSPLGVEGFAASLEKGVSLPYDQNSHPHLVPLEPDEYVCLVGDETRVGRDNEMMVRPQCSKCGVRGLVRPLSDALGPEWCSTCGSDDLRWVRVSGSLRYGVPPVFLDERADEKPLGVFKPVM